MEPISGGLGLRKQLIRKYLKFVHNIKNCTKPVIKHMFEHCKKDARTITGSNLRNILLLTDLPTIANLSPSVRIDHNEIMDKDMWRVDIIKEIFDIKFGGLDTPEGWSWEELDEIENFVCIS